MNNSFITIKSYSSFENRLEDPSFVEDNRGVKHHYSPTYSKKVNNTNNNNYLENYDDINISGEKNKTKHCRKLGCNILPDYQK